MKAVIRFMMFSIMLNLATGLMQDAIPGAFDDPASRRGMEFDSEVLGEFSNEMNNTIQPTGDLEASDSAFDRLLDKLNLGIISKINTVVQKYMFGFFNIIGNVLTVSSFWIFWLKTLVTFGYVFAAISLWTGKDVARG